MQLFLSSTFFNKVTVIIIDLTITELSKAHALRCNILYK